MTTVYLREVDAGTDNACWVVCAKGDPGAVEFAPRDEVILQHREDIAKGRVPDARGEW
jgi:hypothetical protein